MIRTAALAVLGLLLPVALGGCGGTPTPVPPPPTTPVPVVAPSTAASTPSASPTPTPTPSARPEPSEEAVTPPANDPSPVQLEALQVKPAGDRFTVTARLVDQRRQPIIGAVGDFYLEGSRRNLVQSYATGVDGAFSASFGRAEVPEEETLMLHYRGDDQHAAASFLIRKGVPRPVPPPAPPAPPAPAPPAITPEPGSAPTQD